MAALPEEIFRKAALDRLSSPEQLDGLVSFAAPVRRAVVAAVGALLLITAMWSVFGLIQMSAPGSGILLAQGGQVADAMAGTAGALSFIVPVGTSVRKGDVVATLDDGLVKKNLANARSVLHEQEELLGRLHERLDREIAAQQQVNNQQRENLRTIIEVARRRRGFYTAQLAANEPLFAKQYISARNVQEIRQQIETASQAEQRALNDLLRLDSEELEQRGQRDHELTRQQQAINEARRTVEELEIRIKQSMRVVSPADGRVIEIKARPGTVVVAGKPILSIETAGTQLEVMLYIPPVLGKAVAPGMDVRIEPATVKKEEFGMLVGNVRSVSEFPVSPEGMMAVLQNSQLVKRFSAQGAPYAVRIALVPDARTRNGYAWSSGNGPPLRLSSGTIVKAEVMVRNRAPITLVLPTIRYYLGI